MSVFYDLRFFPLPGSTVGVFPLPLLTSNTLLKFVMQLKITVILLLLLLFVMAIVFTTWWGLELGCLCIEGPQKN